MDATNRPMLLIALLFFVNTAPSDAQSPRHGAWVELGLGYGFAEFSCDTCSSSQGLGGHSLSFDVGGTLNPHVRLGAGFSVWLNGLKPEGKLPGIDVVSLLLSYYPRLLSGPFLVGGGGLSHYELCRGTGNPIDPCSSDSSYASGLGWGITLGAGWEIPAGRRTAFRPLLIFHHGAVQALHAPDGAVVATGWRQNLLTVQVGVLVELIK